MTKSWGQWDVILQKKKKVMFNQKTHVFAPGKKHQTWKKAVFDEKRGKKGPKRGKNDVFLVKKEGYFWIKLKNMNPEPLKFRSKKSMKKRNLTFFDTNGHKRARTLGFGGGGGVAKWGIQKGSKWGPQGGSIKKGQKVEK